MGVNTSLLNNEKENPMARFKMICPDCGVEMNYHAEKIDYTSADPKHFDPDFGGVVEEAHSCPVCGMTDTRVKE
jgi:ribosomal protein S27AE